MAQHYDDSYLDLSRKEVNDLFMRDEECTPDIIRIAPGWPIAGSTTLVITGDGLVVVDVGINGDAPGRVERIRRLTQLPYHSLVYTHGHLDHLGGAQVFLDDAAGRLQPRPLIIGHERVRARLDKYRALAGRRAYIARLQFPGRPWRASASPPQPMPLVPPDTIVRDAMKYRVGGLTFEVYHAPAETDDTIWVWVPERRVAVIGDLLIGGCPNTGNPLKEQRFTLEWAQALERIAGMNPEYVIAGAGPIIRGNLVDDVLLSTARFLRTIHDQVVDLLNKEFWIEDIIQRVRVPPELARKPWLAPAYGHPDFIVHDVYRRYTGWYNGNPSELFPAPPADIAAEVLCLSGGAERVMLQARRLNDEGKSQLALHLIDFAILGAGDTGRRKEALSLKSDILNSRADIEPSLIARNILRTGAALVKQQAEG